MQHAEDLAASLAAAGLSLAQMKRLEGHPFTFALYSDVRIVAGRLSGTRLNYLALPIPDDPLLPPPGIHTQPDLGMIGQAGVHASALGADWAYWSRPIHQYVAAQAEARILSHIQSVFRDA